MHLTGGVLILRGGRVIDPGSDFDAVADVTIDGATVTAVGPATAGPGDTVVDVAGYVVGPGFVDLHSHVHSVAGQRLQAMDGVTTALDLEAGLMPVERAYDEAARAGRPLHYGFSASWAAARAQVLLGDEPDASIWTTLALLGRTDWQRSSSVAERERWLGLLERELAGGALGIGILQGYAPRTDPAEFTAVAALAARAGAPTFTHVRELVEADPTTPVDGSHEIVRAAAETGAAMHHCHVNSTSRRHVERVLALLDDARAAGSRVSVECYPYGAGATAIGAAFLAPERLPAWGLQPSDLVVVETGERVADEARLRALRRDQPEIECLVEFLDEDDPADLAHLERALAYPDAIVASDAGPVLWADARDTRAWPLPPGGRTHPRTAGTYARSLRVMVRETGTWSWPDAFRRCSYLPARLLDEVAPAARTKGVLRAGGDADVVVLDPDAVTDTATYADGARPSRGVRHLLVAGTFVVRDGELQPDAYPGRGLRGVPR
ncbi:N-acyl-D-aspartate/D-glutamate deacylase [Jatrophihabitans endophyticus]|uniref:N-acyl-D-aspartate/D-glutamate deacylase n=1 Tax=Jatrophihabitans endophyticus TaxID=1206085 RepID=A0A1M5DSQ5_9ACTN|nr:N-acyl-D-aspartate/D-glutamate deacylase [Jatrophihabitans endophyticus]